MQRVEVIEVGHDDDLVVRNSRADIVAAVYQLEHERLVLVRQRIGAAGGRIAPLFHQFHQQPRALSRAGRTLRQRASQVVGKAALAQPALVVHRFAGRAHAVGHDQHAVVVVEHVGVGQADLVGAEFHPIVAESVCDLGNPGAALLGGQARSLGPVHRGHDRVPDGDVAAVVLIVSHHHAACPRGVFAGDDGHAVHKRMAIFIQIKGEIVNRIHVYSLHCDSLAIHCTTSTGRLSISPGKIAGSQGPEDAPRGRSLRITRAGVRIRSIPIIFIARRGAGPRQTSHTLPSRRNRNFFHFYILWAMIFSLFIVHPRISPASIPAKSGKTIAFPGKFRYNGGKG